MRSVSLSIAGYFRATPVQRVTSAEPGVFEATARWSERIADRIVHTQQAHFQYPILHYFRPADDSWALPIQLGKILELRQSARAGRDNGMTAHPSYGALFEAVDDYIADMNTHFVPGPMGRSERDIQAALQRIRTYMAYS